MSGSLPGCIICGQSTARTAEMAHEGGTSPIAMCADCQALAARFGVGGSRPRRNWLPRLGIVPNSTPGLDDCDDPHTLDFDGRSLVIVWGRFVFALFLGRRP